MVEMYVIPALVFGALGLFAAVLLTVCSKVFEVKTDERIDAVSEALPQVNCGSCGFSGCSDYAKAIVKDGAPTNLCKPGGKECAAKIASIMGVEGADVEAMVAVVRCNGNCTNTEDKYKYEGISSCKAANRFYNGSAVCIHGCLGYGDCAVVCPQGAISIKDNLASVDRSKCIGCGMCVKECPNNLIVVHSISQQVDVCCSSTESAKISRANCKVGCIGCKKCEKNCPEGAITVADNLARIDYSKCTNCGTCVSNCPVKAIHNCMAKTPVETADEGSANK